MRVCVCVYRSLSPSIQRERERERSIDRSISLDFLPQRSKREKPQEAPPSAARCLPQEWPHGGRPSLTTLSVSLRAARPSPSAEGPRSGLPGGRHPAPRSRRLASRDRAHARTLACRHGRAPFRGRLKPWQPDSIAPLARLLLFTLVLGGGGVWARLSRRFPTFICEVSEMGCGRPLPAGGGACQTL